jgi:bis(5'-nucleosidyl)-tetraphosphatase
MEPKPIERSYGFIVVNRTGGTTRLLLVHQVAGNWSYPKGHAHEGEQPLAAAKRELLEECGISEIEIVPDVTFHEEYDFMREGIATHKINTFFLCFVKSTDVRPQAGEIQECRFATYDEALPLFQFSQAKQVLSDVRKALLHIK